MDPSSGHTYYFNAPLGVTQWEPPAGSAAASSGAAAASARSEFEKSDNFQGTRVGYVFKRGPKGVGYYLDKGPMAAGRGAGGGASISAAATVTARVGPTVDVISAGEGLERGPKKSRLEQIAEAQAARNAALRRGGRGSRGGDEMDPMDPSSYSDVPKGGWSSGLESSRK